MTSPGPLSEPTAVGPDAWLVRLDDAEAAASLALRLRSGGLRCADVVPAADSVLVDGLRDVAPLRDLVARWRAESQREGQAGRPGAGRPGREVPLVEVPVTYDGPDLSEVARLWGVDVDEVVRRHTGLEFVATFSGFAPGFSYLSGLPADWTVPRRPSPRDRVPAGAVALADRWCGVYPTASPGGWQLLGRTTLVVWDLERAEGPALLAPGTRVRFVAR